MAEVIGPCSTLPGAHHSVPKDTMCDSHPGRPATHRVQGETDSFGAELNDMCLECYEQHKVELAAYKEEMAHGTCDWCSNGATDLRDARDYDEGMYGPLYRVCGACIKRRNDAAEEELEASGYYDHDPVYDDDPVEIGEDDALDEELEASWIEAEQLNYVKDMGRTLEEVLGNDLPAGHPKAFVDGKFYF